MCTHLSLDWRLLTLFLRKSQCSQQADNQVVMDSLALDLGVIFCHQQFQQLGEGQELRNKKESGERKGRRKRGRKGRRKGGREGGTESQREEGRGEERKEEKNIPVHFGMHTSLFWTKIRYPAFESLHLNKAFEKQNIMPHLWRLYLVFSHCASRLVSKSQVQVIPHSSLPQLAPAALLCIFRQSLHRVVPFKPGVYRSLRSEPHYCGEPSRSHTSYIKIILR